MDSLDSSQSQNDVVLNLKCRAICFPSRKLKWDHCDDYSSIDMY